ncbi:MAG TPA: CehA/McbA family metallohydrolase [Gemmatimonadaceae bacterium]|nr:CehA/McbA family metallohydrolase [Gemmatimonadaceae bacterium]
MTCRAFAAALVALAALGWQSAHAQRREAPLSQVNVPHGYYWREMYVPQVTSGPSSFAWSPDGHEVIYSMQGSLWRQRLGTTVATQLTAGDTYDFQPDWSPDGRSVLYAAYDGKSLALMLLDLPTGETRPLIDDGNVNVDARWSPDGKRIAFVSTAYNRRWHVFVAKFANARVDSVTRITDDKNSGLPRYYYSAWDHYLSPTWSPDGHELIVVSNRGHIYGTGGLWRMEARPGAPMRELYYEETAWRARPDWARDGKRVVFSSYHGGQWNQLWLTRSEPADPMQLTYGDFDVTAPRWSPDMTRIGFISNESGNTALWTVTVPGGKRDRIDARTRRYREPSGRIAIAVLDSATRRALPVRLSVRGASGRFFVPDTRWRHADEAIVRDAQRFEYGYWHSNGADTLSVPPGRYQVEAWHGPEWRTTGVTVDVTAGKTTSARINLARLANLPASGWWGGDVHVHMNYGGSYRNTPAHLAMQARAEGLHVVENLAVNKEQRIPDITTWKPGLLYSARDLIIANGQEFHTSNVWGHSAVLGARDHYLLPDYAGYDGTAFASLFPTNAAIFDLAHEQGALAGYVHPFDSEPDISVVQGGVPYELPVDVALGKVDYMEVMGYSDHLITSNIWYKLLNCGFKIPAAAGTDAFPNFAQLRGPPGLVRVYAKSGPVLDHTQWLQAIKAGRTFVTNAPMISFTLDGREAGSELRLPFGRHRLRARVTMQSNVPVNHLEIIGNGTVVARLIPGRDTTVVLNVDRPGWYLVRGYADAPRLPVLDLYPFASTSPVYVSMGDAPRACGADAEYFLKWIDLLSQRVRADTNWNTPSERDRALALISRAHEEFIRRR